MESATTGGVSTGTETARQSCRRHRRCSWRLSSRILVDDRPVQPKCVHPAPRKRTERFIGCPDDGLAAQIERRVQDHGHAGRIAERPYESMVPRIRVGPYGLQPGGAVDMSDRRDLRPDGLAHRGHQQHESRGVLPGRFLQIEPVRRALLEDRGGKWPVWLAKLYFRIDDVLHIRLPGIRKNAAIAKCARSPLARSLYPARDLS